MNVRSPPVCTGAEPAPAGPGKRSLPIPHGEYDVPLIVSDLMFNADGSLLFDSSDEKGLYGDVISVNGVPWPVMQVARRKYRFRILNASVSRSYAWYLDNGAPMWVVATDAGLVPVPQRVTSFRHGVSERYEVVIDFREVSPQEPGSHCATSRRRTTPTTPTPTR